MRKRIVAFAAGAFALLLAPALVRSQIMSDLSTSNFGGRDSVVGTVYLPDRRPAGRGILIKMNKFGNDVSTWTDSDGKFIVNNIGNGTYTISVEAGDEYEPASQRLEVTQPRGSAPQSYYLNIQLRWRPNMHPKPAVIHAAVARAPKKAQEHYQKGLDAAAKGDNQAAVDELLKAVAEYPEFSAAHAELGVQYQKLNQLEKADEHFVAALKIDPNAYQAMANRGVILVRLKKFADAENVLREAIKIKDESAVTHFYLGRALVGLNRPDDAIGEFRLALLMGGMSMNEARRALANIYIQRGENDKAVSELEQYLSVNPTPADEKKLRDTLQQLKVLAKETRKP
jgi:tetratricopeptide (TPR) repeat protein